MSIMNKSAEPNFAVGQASQQQFLQYVIALTFTILGFSIQSSHFGVSRVADLLEIASWALLFTSGIHGLLRWEGFPIIYTVYGHQSSNESTIAELEMAKVKKIPTVVFASSGESHPVGEAIEKHLEYSRMLEDTLTPHVERGSRHNKWQRWNLGIGFLVLIMARAYIPLVSIAASLIHHAPYSIP